MKKSLVIIPSRIGSTRLPNKPLIDLCGKTLIERVYTGAKKSKLADKVVVATDSFKVVEIIEKMGGEAYMTPSELETGTDRVSYLAEEIGKDFDIIVNVQGDEPLVTGEMVDELIKSMLEKDNPVMSTLKVKLTEENQISNPNFVKVVCDRNNYAIYFSRSVIPFNRESLKGIKYFKHLGYYAYTKEFLKIYSLLDQTLLEKTEMLEQLRALENGYKIKVIEIQNDTYEINTPEDIKIFEEKYNQNMKNE